MHTDKQVREVFKEAREAGWELDEYPGGRSKAFGALLCGQGCRHTVLRTPKGDGQSKILREKLAKCPHGRAIPLRR